MKWSSFFVSIIAWSVLAGVTPASGFISSQNSFILGIVLGLGSYYAILLLMEHWKVDDALDVSSVHGVTGTVSALAIGLVPSTLINPAGPDVLFYGNPMQLAIQMLGVSVAAVLGFGGTVVIMKVIDKMIGLKVKEEEEIGLDVMRTQSGRTSTNPLHSC